MVRGLKTAVKHAAVAVVARVAPATWRWRTPGSLVVLMYHRVLPKDSPLRLSEQPGMYVSSETLDLHVRELKRRFELVHLDDWLRRAEQGQALPRIACALTFDDGWRDNYDFALPVLVKHQAPATIFLVSSYIGTFRRFWPNRLIDLIHEEFSQPGSVHLPEPLRAPVAAVLGRARARGRLDNEAIDPIVQQALKLPEDAIRALVDAAEGDRVAGNSVRETLDAHEIALLADSGLVRFGSHSATHFRLQDGTAEDVLTREIVQSRAVLQTVCRQPIDLFCYPNGVTGAAAVTLASRHYLGAVSTASGWHAPGGNPYRIPRVAVHDDISSTQDAFLACLSGWL